MQLCKSSSGKCPLNILIENQLNCYGKGWGIDEKVPLSSDINYSSSTRSRFSNIWNTSRSSKSSKLTDLTLRRSLKTLIFLIVLRIKSKQSRKESSFSIVSPRWIKPIENPFATKNAAEDRSFHLRWPSRSSFELGTKKKKQFAHATQSRTGKGAKRVLPCRGTRGRATTDANSVSKIVPGPFISSSELLSSKVVITGGRYLPGRNRLDGAAEAPINFTTDHVSTIAAAAAAASSFPNHTFPPILRNILPLPSRGRRPILNIIRYPSPDPSGRPLHRRTQITEIIKNC